VASDENDVRKLQQEIDAVFVVHMFLVSWLLALCVAY